MKFRGPEGGGNSKHPAFMLENVLDHIKQLQSFRGP